MNKKAKGVTELLIMLIMIVLTSGIVLLLVQSGIIEVKAENEQVPLLNTEFIPMGRGGTLAVKEFSFCGYVDEQYNCLGESDIFLPGDAVYFRFVAESSTYNGDVMVAENYRLKSPSGKVLLDVSQKENFHFNMQSNNDVESVTFKDYFTLSEDAETGTYTLELVLDNPLLGKRVTQTESFEVEELSEEEFMDEEYVEEI